MLWQEDDTDKTHQVPDNIVDVLFAIDCKRLPVDHAYALSVALCSTLPWMAAEPDLAVHAIHMAGSQNGWERPEHGTDRHLIVSRRTKLIIRLPKARAATLIAGLQGQTLEVAGCPLTIGEGKPRGLGSSPTLLARYVASRFGENEEQFLDWAAETLSTRGVKVRKALCGKETPLATPEGPVHTRSLLLADLSPDDSVRLQQWGLGPHRAMGCGIFIPHKGIDAVHKSR